MPHSPRSLHITSLYQRRVFGLRRQVQVQAQRMWPTLQGFDSSDWDRRMAVVLTQAQSQGVRAAGGYLTAFLTSELGRRVRGPVIETRVGLSRDGRDLQEALKSPLIGVLAKFKEGAAPQDALAYGLNRGLRMVGDDFDHAHRTALLDAIKSDDRFTGWNRATTGTCGACLGASAEEIANFETHPNCECVSEPVVRNLPNLAPRLTGMALFDSMTPEHQNEVLGDDTAELVRNGTVPLHRLKQRTPLEQGQDFITQRPFEALQ